MLVFVGRIVDEEPDRPRRPGFVVVVPADHHDLTAGQVVPVGVATAELFPRFFLTGAAGLQSLESSDFFDAGSRFWSLGPSLRWPIFTAGRIRQKIRVENARQEQSLIRYEETVLIALEEVQNALVAFGKEQERYRALIASQSASRRAVTR